MRYIYKQTWFKTNQGLTGSTYINYVIDIKINFTFLFLFNIFIG